MGVLLALFLTGRLFGLTAFIGLLMLIGIVVKNGILLVDYTTQLRARGMPRDEAILTAAPTRLRPILMTTCAAILADHIDRLEPTTSSAGCRTRRGSAPPRRETIQDLRSRAKTKGGEGG